MASKSGAIKESNFIKEGRKKAILQAPDLSLFSRHSTLPPMLDIPIFVLMQNTHPAQSVA